MLKLDNPSLLSYNLDRVIDMSSTKFTVTEHISHCQYVRGFPHCVKSEDAKLQLAVKEYRPRRSLPRSAAESAVTMLVAQGNGFPKVNMLWHILLSNTSTQKAGLTR